MSGSKGKVWLAAAAICGAALSVPAVSHFDDKEMPQSYRQSYFALLAANFRPMVASVKGEVPWDQVKMENWANDLAALSTLDVMRGFVDGSDKGTTRAKPEIWKDKADFTSKMETLHKELASLQQVGDMMAASPQEMQLAFSVERMQDQAKSQFNQAQGQPLTRCTRPKDAPARVMNTSMVSSSSGVMSTIEKKLPFGMSMRRLPSMLVP